MELPFDIENPDYEYIVTKDHAEKALDLLSKEKIIAVDVESTGLDPYTGDLLLIQIGTDKITYIFDARKIVFTDLPLFKQILEDTKIVKLLQNGKFDYKYIKVKTGVEIKNIYDTMLAEAVLTAGLGGSASLGAITAKHIGPGLLDKSLQNSFVGMSKNQGFSDAQLKYAGLDTLILFPIMRRQLSLLKQHNVVKIAKLEFATTTVVGDMELRGIYLNKDKWVNIIKGLEQRRDDIAKEFQETIRPYYNSSQHDLFGGMADVINLNSQQQLMDLFNNKLGLDLPSTGSGILANYHHPVVNMLSKYRGYEKLISAFGYSLLDRINPVTHRIHPDFQQLRAATGRFSCSNPNVQQIPRNSEEAPFRECFNPEKGYKLVVSDYSAFEMRILADLSGDEKMLHAIREGLDIHSYTASLMFNKPYSDDFKKKFPELRQMAKPIGFGLMYGMGAMGLVSSIKMQTGKEISVEESEDLIKRYFRSYPSVEKFLEKQAKDAIRNGWSATPAGRKRWYKKPEKTDPEYRRKISKIGREAKNHPIQGTNADAIKYALVYVDERIKKDGIDGGMVLTVHDEIACEVREDQAEEFAKSLQEEMIRAGELFLTKVPVVSDPFVGDVWEH